MKPARIWPWGVRTCGSSAATSTSSAADERGDDLTLVGAIRRGGWVVLSTKWRAMNKGAFITWVRRRLAPRLRRGDIVVLDNLPAHKASEVRFLIEARGATVKRLPPYSHDFNPIEPAWSLVKKRIRDYAPLPLHGLQAPSS